jgi:hypothetical protein
MSYEVGSFTQASVGDTDEIVVGFEPAYLRFTISQLEGVPENSVAHLSVGFTDGNVEYAHSIYANGNNAYTRKHNTFCLTHHAIVNNTFTRVVSATLKEFTSNGFVLTFDRASSAYQITFEAYPA